MTIAVRQATIDDLPKLALLFDSYRQFYGAAPDLRLAHQFLSDRFSNQQSIIFLALADHEAAIGFTQLYPSFSSFSAARIYILNDLFVAANARRLGAGKALLAAAASFARAAGAVRLTLSTARTNSTAQALYAAQGWVKDEVFCGYSFSLTN